MRLPYIHRGDCGLLNREADKLNSFVNIECIEKSRRVTRVAPDEQDCDGNMEHAKTCDDPCQDEPCLPLITYNKVKAGVQDNRRSCYHRPPAEANNDRHRKIGCEGVESQEYGDCVNQDATVSDKHTPEIEAAATMEDVEYANENFNDIIY